jgi:hypothetical protein
LILAHARSWQHYVPESGGLLPTGGAGVKNARAISWSEQRAAWRDGNAAVVWTVAGRGGEPAHDPLSPGR